MTDFTPFQNLVIEMISQFQGFLIFFSGLFFGFVFWLCVGLGFRR